MLTVYWSVDVERLTGQSLRFSSLAWIWPNSGGMCFLPCSACLFLITTRLAWLQNVCQSSKPPPPTPPASRCFHPPTPTSQQKGRKKSDIWPPHRLRRLRLEELLWVLRMDCSMMTQRICRWRIRWETNNRYSSDSMGIKEKTQSPPRCQHICPPLFTARGVLKTSSNIFESFISHTLSKHSGNSLGINRLKY